MKSRSLKIEFQSDWHIGSGFGIPGSVDRQVLRDSRGIPYIPGKTLTGIIRDAAEFIAQVRGDRFKKLPSKLFGNQPETHGGAENEKAEEAKIGISSAELPKSVCDYIVANDLTSALFYVQPGIKIDSKTGCTEKDHLFSIEKVRRECVFYAEVTFFQELSDDEVKLLDDAIKAVRHIGGKRRRGAGLCRLSWSTGLKEKEMPHSTPFAHNDSDAPLILKIRLTNLQPLVAASRTVGNAVQSSNEIPGYMLLSYYVNQVFAPLGKERMCKAVLNNEISVSNFLPELEGDIALPVPLCMAEKKESKELVNRLVSEPSGKEQMKDIRTGCVRVLSNEVRYYSSGVQKITRTHNTVEDSSQKPDETTGGLFTYEAVDSGQKFIGTLKIEKTLLEDILQSEEKENIFSKLSGDVHKIGRSRKDEYGETVFELVSQEISKSGPISLIEGRTQNKYLVIYLKSALLLKDCYNSYSTKIEDVKKALSEKLEVELEDIPPDEWIEKGDNNISPIGGTHGHCIRTGRCDSWQIRWTLPRPSLVCFREGSIFTFKVSDPENWNEERAKSLSQNGLGERIAEGYGQILINPDFICNPSMKLTRAVPVNTNTVSSKFPDSEEAANFVRLLQKDKERRRFRQIARCEAYSIVREANRRPFENYLNVSCEKDKRPSASQFGALREAVSAGHAVFQKWVRVIDKDNSMWNEQWRKMLNDLADRPEILADLRPAFADIQLDTPEDFLGIFLDVLCEAVFDDEKDDEKRMKGAVNE